MKKLLIYNIFTKTIGIKIHRLIRRIRRPKWMKDEEDQFFLMRKWLKKYQYDPKLANKYEVKKILKNVIESPKTLFTWDKKGDIIEGKVPSTGKVVLKHSNGSNFVKIVNANKIDEKMLKKLYKKWELYGSMYGTFLEEVQYKKAGNTFFAEEFIEDNITDYKIHYFDKNNYTFLRVLDRKNNKFPYQEWNMNFEPMLDDTKMKLAPKISKEEQEKFKSLLPICEKISKQIGEFYFRGDFYFSNDKPMLGEITLSNSAGKVYEGKGNKDERIRKYNDFFIRNYKKVNHV